MSTKHIEALKLALEGAANYIDALGGDSRKYRQALVEQPAQQEPVAWMHWLHGPVRMFFNKDEAQMELERLNREYPVDAGSRKMRPLVFGDTSPPAQRKPLTDDEIESINVRLAGSRDLARLFARAIEAKLKEKNT